MLLNMFRDHSAVVNFPKQVTRSDILQAISLFTVNSWSPSMHTLNSISLQAGDQSSTAIPGHSLTKELYMIAFFSRSLTFEVPHYEPDNNIVIFADRTHVLCIIKQYLKTTLRVYTHVVCMDSIFCFRIKLMTWNCQVRWTFTVCRSKIIRSQSFKHDVAIAILWTF